ncbi:hypothetical protein BDW75DRAFT_204405 [Aspergillus navahoensis]
MRASAIRRKLLTAVGVFTIADGVSEVSTCRGINTPETSAVRAVRNSRNCSTRERLSEYDRVTLIECSCLLKASHRRSSQSPRQR